MIPLSEALHSVIARTIIVRDDSPPFDSSAMDGYGVKVKDIESAGAGENIPRRGKEFRNSDASLPSGTLAWKWQE